MIADVTMPDGTIERMTLPKPIMVPDGSIKSVYVGRRTARIVVEWRGGGFNFVDDKNRSYVEKFPRVRAAIDAVKEPRPL